MEQFVVSWLLEIVGGKMDFRQYGGTKGNSVSHYLIEFINFILFQQESASRAVLACHVDMKKQLNSVTVEARPQPDDYRCRTGHQLKSGESKLFQQLKKTQELAADNHMKLNVAKTNFMLFIPCKEMDFMPEMELESSRINLVEKAKLLGVVLTSNLSWEDNTYYIVERSNSNILMLKD